MNFKKSLIFPLIFLITFVTGTSADNYSTQCIAEPEKVSEETLLIPGGQPIGVTLYTKGVLVVDISDVVSADGTHLSPSKDAGIKKGDLITFFNESPVSDVEDLSVAISTSCGKKSSVTINRDNKEKKLLITPTFSKTDEDFKIGAWVKDAASGIGTITFYNPKTKEFAALGHAIYDNQTNEIVPISGGSILPSSIVSVEKSEKGIPGELNGVFDESVTPIGKITKNTELGIFGTAEKAPFSSVDPLLVAYRDEVKTGKAFIFSCIDGENTNKYEIEILRIFPKSLSPQKGMVIKITDKNLIEKTGGIVRGMSGSPIIQNAKLVGAVTHVFVNDPTRGYGIFIENMLNN